MWYTLLIGFGILTAITFLMGVFVFFYERLTEKRWNCMNLLVGLILVPFLIFLVLMSIVSSIEIFWDFIRDKKEAKKTDEIREALQNNEMTREEVPRKLDGKKKFEFKSSMGLAAEYWSEVREIVYVEREYNEILNSFFQRHRNLRLYYMYKFVYLPHLREDLMCDDSIVRYFHPGLVANDLQKFSILDSFYPLQFLCYPDDMEKISHGMFFFHDFGTENYGMKYILGGYYPLEEGNDEEIINQLHAIVKNVHYDYSKACLNSVINKPEIEEGATDEYADELFPWIIRDDTIAGLVDEVRERLQMLKEMGLPRHLLKALLEDEKPKLSRLVVTEDWRILLPDYGDMEIRMEPLNKAVFLLFLRHPEGIVFKQLPGYKKELTRIYEKIKPYGMTERARKSIDDVTNPCLNSINEKCARIRGAFISMFDEELAQNYFITGARGEAKCITLPRKLVVCKF